MSSLDKQKLNGLPSLYFSGKKTHKFKYDLQQGQSSVGYINKQFSSKIIPYITANSRVFFTIFPKWPNGTRFSNTTAPTANNDRDLYEYTLPDG